MCSFAANVFEALPILCILEFDDPSLSPIAATSHGRTSFVSEISWMHLDHLQAALGHELLETHNDLQQAALASAAEEQASRHGKRNAFDIILQGVVQVSQGRNLVSLFVQLLPGFLPAYACKFLAFQQHRRPCCKHFSPCALHHAVHAQNKQWHKLMFDSKR